MFASGLFHVTVCTDCGLTQLFASTIDARSLRNSAEWQRQSDLKSPLGLGE
jgi:hypothetical protein